MENVKDRTRKFISKHIQAQDIQNDQDIFAAGFVNSLFAMQLVMFVEKEFNIQIQNYDLSLDNFRSVDAIANLVNRKLDKDKVEIDET
jgi:acyl carrier protein